MNRGADRGESGAQGPAKLTNPAARQACESTIALAAPGTTLRKAARYLRVSRGDQQTTQNQIPETEAWLSANGYGLDQACDYVDEMSGWNPRKRLPHRERLIRDAAAGLLRGMVLLVWSLDRLSRRGIRDTFEVLEGFKEAGVFVVSVKEPWFDMRAENPFREIMLALVAWAAKFESDRKSQRVRASYLAKKEKDPNASWGRKAKPVNMDLLRRLRKEGLGYRRLAKAMGCSVGLVHKLLKATTAH
jgi:DNA invertase Pin-like site-specific DNA recombinase